MSEKNNALMITAQYPAENYNLLVPMQTIAEIAEIHKPVINAVQISTNLDDKEIYEQEKGYTDRTNRIHEPKYALTKKGLNKLMRAAGIKILSSRPIVPSTCQKCAAVNQSIGRPVNCGACGNKDVKFEAKISVPQLTGENIELVACKEIIVDDVIVGMTDKQRTEFLKFRSEMCETKAINRALRAAMHIKGTYTMEELKKPFVVAYLVPNLDNEAVKAEAVRHFFSATNELYGNGTTTGTRKTLYVEDDDEGFDNEVPNQPIASTTQPYEQVELQQYYETIPQQAAVPPVQAGSNFQCCSCGKKISNKVFDYSINRYGRPYCMDCQKTQGGARK